MTKAEEFREKARELEERAQRAPTDRVREALLAAAERWREGANELEQYEMPDEAPLQRPRR